MPLDGHSSAPPRSRGGLMLAGLALAFVLGVVALAGVARNGVSTTWIDGGYWALGIATAAAIALAAGMRAGGMVAPWLGGLAIATETISATFFLGAGRSDFRLGP